MDTRPLAIFGIIIAILLALAFYDAERVKAHEALSGWSYPSECCSTMDCRQVPDGFVERITGGYEISTTHEKLPYNDPRIKNSPDGKWHWCSVAGSDSTETICLFRPPDSI